MFRAWKEEWIVEMDVYGGGECYLLQDGTTTIEKDKAYRFPSFKAACETLGNRDPFSTFVREEPEDAVAFRFTQVGWTVEQWKQADYDPEVLP